MIKFRAIKPKKMNPQVFVNAWNEEARRFADTNLRKDFNTTQSTFKRKFPIVVRDESGNTRIAWACVVQGEIYFYVSEGTSVRWALMSQDWRSKTKPGRLRPGRGRGRVIIAGRRAMQARGIGPRPGIKGRDYPTLIAKRNQRKFERDVQAATRKAAGGLFV